MNCIEIQHCRKRRNVTAPLIVHFGSDGCCENKKRINPLNVILLCYNIHVYTCYVLLRTRKEKIFLVWVIEFLKTNLKYVTSMKNLEATLACLNQMDHTSFHKRTKISFHQKINSIRLSITLNKLVMKPFKLIS